jgi:hypothetical protein
MSIFLLSFPGTWPPEDAALEQMDNGDWGYMVSGFAAAL